MTDQRYLADSSIRQFEATVERVFDDGRVVLDGTHFYPTGGGQPADTGTITHENDCWRVTDVHKRETIHHELATDTAPDLEPGTTVVGELDWDRRYGHMRYHTAQHLLSAHLLEAYDAPTTGNQLYADRARLDCEHGRFGETAQADIEAAINDLIEADLPVRWYELERTEAEARLDLERTRIDLLPDHITDIRIVEIGEEDEPLDRVACAGTHVESTGELGRLEIEGRETGGAGRERLRFQLRE